MTFIDKEDISRPPWRPREIEDPEQLAAHFVSYARYVEDNPLFVEKVFCAQDGGVIPQCCESPDR